MRADNFFSIVKTLFFSCFHCVTFKKTIDAPRRIIPFSLNSYKKHEYGEYCMLKPSKNKIYITTMIKCVTSKSTPCLSEQTDFRTYYTMDGVTVIHTGRKTDRQSYSGQNTVTWFRWGYFLEGGFFLEYATLPINYPLYYRFPV